MVHGGEAFWVHFLSLQLCAFALLFTASLISSGDIPSNSSSSSSLGITTETLSLRSKPTLDLTYASISSGVSPSKGSSSPPNIPFPRMKSNQYFYNSFTPQAIKVLLLKTEKKTFACFNEQVWFGPAATYLWHFLPSSVRSPSVSWALPRAWPRPSRRRLSLAWTCSWTTSPQSNT